MSAGLQSDLIAAVATPPGQGGIGVVRLSGGGAREIAEQICGRSLQPRHATYCDFCDGDEILDQTRREKQEQDGEDDENDAAAILVIITTAITPSRRDPDADELEDADD